MTSPALDVMAVLVTLQQQLSDLTGVVQVQQRTLQRLLGAPDSTDSTNGPVASTAGVGGSDRQRGAVPPAHRRPGGA